MSQIGKQVVDFKVQAFVNGDFKEVSKQDVLGKWSIFFFYPADFTFVCPTELEDLANLYEEFKATGTEIYSVSTDTHFVHKAWHDTSDTIKKIDYTMLADPTGVLSRGFDVMIEEAGLAERGTFVVNPEGEIVSYEVVAGNVGRNAAELLRKLKALQFVAKNPSEVCPAKWEEGNDTLEPSIDLVGKI
ncbi:alkyl hydroperoxide reductase subunit C [Flavobacteriaceae bacterium]|nr:alkyl hydroperoxide reductase subunit C [Flavobacteriaceae bacterium]